MQLLGGCEFCWSVLEAAPGLTARSLGNLDDGSLRAVVAAWENPARSVMAASEPGGKAERCSLAGSRRKPLG